MRWSYNLERSRAVAVWLVGVALLVIAILAVGGATRLTGSGLSIVEWRPVTGVIPPLSQQGWAAEFAKYQHIPQYQLINRGMSLEQFKWIYGWEWTHRLLARLAGIIFFVPLLVFLLLRRIPQRLIWRCAVIFGLGGLQGAVGWWMVSSGLAHRTSVAPERLATHLGLALLLFAACLWTALEAWFGRARGRGEAEPKLQRAASGVAVLAYLQSLLGALVSGDHAGLIDQDWPLMAGRFVPEGYRLPGQSLLSAMVHSAAAVQFDHRMVAYLLFACALGFALALRRARAPGPVRSLGWALAAAVTLQASLGVAVLRFGDPLWLAGVHQLGAVAVLSVALILAWRIRRI